MVTSISIFSSQGETEEAMQHEREKFASSNIDDLLNGELSYGMSDSLRISNSFRSNSKNSSSYCNKEPPKKHKANVSITLKELLGPHQPLLENSSDVESFQKLGRSEFSVYDFDLQKNISKSHSGSDPKSLDVDVEKLDSSKSGGSKVFFKVDHQSLSRPNNSFQQQESSKEAKNICNSGFVSEPMCETSELLTLIYPSPNITKKFRLRRDTLTESTFFKRVKSVIGPISVKEFSYDDTVNGDTYSFCWGDTEGAAIFLRCTRINIITLYSKAQDTKNVIRHVRKKEELGKVEKSNMSKSSVFSQLDYIRYSKNKELYTTLKDDRCQIMKVTGVYVSASLILNRCCLICPICNNEEGLKPKHDGGLHSLITHMRAVHKDNPVAVKMIRNFNTRNDEELTPLNPYERQIFKDWSQDPRFCNLQVVEDLIRGDRRSLSQLPKQSAADYFLPSRHV